MTIPLPNLDDRRWTDLVDEGRALIPLYAPEWTDHNIHDPGITLIELFAWIAEMDIYWLNRIPERHRRKFLALVGIVPHPPAASHTVLSFSLPGGTQSLSLPATVEFSGRDPFGREVRFRTLDPVTIAPGRLEAVQIRDGKRFHNVTDLMLRKEEFRVWGDVAQPGAELYLGFSRPLPLNEPVSLYFIFSGSRSGESERQRIIEEAMRRRKISLYLKQACRPPLSDALCDGREATPGEEKEAPVKMPPHHGVRTVWEFLTAAGGENVWLPLNPADGEVYDDTRSFTLDGRVRVSVPGRMSKASIGRFEAELFYLRCRFEVGAYDAPPVVRCIAMNGAAAEQAVPAVMKWTIAAGAKEDFLISMVEGRAPLPGEVRGLNLRLDARGEITRLSFAERGGDAPEFTVLEFVPPSDRAAGALDIRKSSLSVEASLIGSGTGRPDQELTLSQSPAEEPSFRLCTLERNASYKLTDRSFIELKSQNVPDDILGKLRSLAGKEVEEERLFSRILKAALCDEQAARFGSLIIEEAGQYGWRGWQLRRDFDASTRSDAHFLLDPATGTVTFGDGEKGRVPPKGALIIAAYRFTRAQDGNLTAGTINRLVDSPHNRAVLKNFEAVKESLAAITNPLAAAGGTAAETVAMAAGRAIELTRTPTRAVTLRDYERLALEAPGTRLARAKAIANFHPGFPCFKAPGVITLVILPDTGTLRPSPGRGLRRAIAKYLNRRRIIGTRLEVTGPTYKEVAVHARVRARAGVNKTNLQRRIADALIEFLHPLRGGPGKTGWPFGRDVYRSEILQIIDEVPGVDHVLSLEFIADGCNPECGNVCLAPTWLVAAGRHEIEVI
ncbi:MAG: putative baseplate assembly protein [Blastocatellia bacterium]|nr:putative baseplate assembly protein [Blastocatellia bacterium]